MVLEALSGEKTPAQSAKEYRIHLNSVVLSKKQFLEKSIGFFWQDSALREYEGRIGDLKHLLWGRKKWRSRCQEDSWARTAECHRVSDSCRTIQEGLCHSRRPPLRASGRCGRPRSPALQPVLPSEAPEGIHGEICAPARAVRRNCPGICCLWRPVSALRTERDIRPQDKPQNRADASQGVGVAASSKREIAQAGWIRQVIRTAGDHINPVATKEEIGPFEAANADFTALVCADRYRKAHLILIVDHARMIVLGWSLGERAATEVALRACEYAREALI